MHRADQGTDACKRIIGCKRHLGCDPLGLLLTVLVTAASVSDIAAGHLARPHRRRPSADTHGVGGRRLPDHRHRPRRPPGHRRPPCPTPAGRHGVHGHAQTLDHRAKHRVAHAPLPMVCA
ncbi:MAG: transposase [Streptomyces sp.]